MFDMLKKMNTRPTPFQYYTADELWTNAHTSKKMLEYHLNESVDISSRNMDFIKRSVDWISNHFKLNAESSVLDLGCGPGLYTNKLTEKGVNVTGVDFSKRSIEYAKQTALGKGLSVQYYNENYLEFETEKKFDLITMIMCDFCALSPAQRKTMLAKMKNMMKPSGKVLLDVYSLNTYSQKNEAAGYEFNYLDHFWAREDYYCFINTYKYDDEKLILDQYTIIEKERVRSVYNWLQCFNVDSLKKEIKENGLTVKEVFADVAGQIHYPSANEFAVVIE